MWERAEAITEAFRPRARRSRLAPRFTSQNAPRSLRDAGDFKKMNEVYAEFFPADRPARTTVEAKFHTAEMLVEIDCIAYKPK